MATSNFCVVNANKYYVIRDTYMDENGNKIHKDCFDYEDDLDRVLDYASNTYGSWYRTEGGDNDRNYHATDICEKTTETFDFGTKKPWFLEVAITPKIVIRNGYYSDAVLDYDIKIEDCGGYDAYLSEGNAIEVMMENLRYLVERNGHECGWNMGTFKMQAKNIEKWLESIIDKTIAECEDICNANAEDKLVCMGTFSNGAALYYKVG